MDKGGRHTNFLQSALAISKDVSNIPLSKGEERKERADAKLLMGYDLPVLIS